MTRTAGKPRRPAWRWRWLVGLYVALLLVSHGVRRLPPDRVEPTPAESIVTPRAWNAGTAVPGKVRLVYLDLGPAVGSAPDAAAAPADRTPALLIHGSPGSKADFRDAAPRLARDRRVLVPDLPGFGQSTRSVPDYSIDAHARYLVDLLDRLGIEQVHVVGFSMGGGVALEMYELAPERVRSMVLLSSIGVQELELLGNYTVNHAIHALQLGALWLLHEAVPHMGRLDGSLLDVAYARNFYDTDQRPLRGILDRFEPPMLILHGRRDVLVPAAAAREHHRIVPQSEIEILDANHFMIFTRGDEMAGRIEAFLERVEAGGAPSRSQADAARVVAASQPFDPSSLPPASGFSLAVVMLLLAVATLISEDLTCVTAGLLVASGRLGFVAASVACGAGIFVGDLLLYLAGRWIGRPALQRAPLRWLIRPERLEIASRWFERRGPTVILLSRFLPGTRLATYFGAGVLRTGFWWFSLYFLLAVALWTPLLVGLSAVLGRPVLGWVGLAGRWGPLLVLLAAFAILLLVKLVVPLFSFRGRRLLVGAWRRKLRWEFWPPWAFYPPVVAYVAWLGIRYRSPLLFTAANPGIEAGGFIAESKSRILGALARSGGPIARFRLLPATLSADERVRAARGFLDAEGADLPAVLKPDMGQRGAGVAIVRDERALRDYLERASYDVIVQEYVPGLEFGVFYYRYPDRPHGRILSITEKRSPVVTGDGRRTLEKLILCDARTVCMARRYMALHAGELGRVPGPGERVSLVELGTHCRGAIFLDGGRLATTELERAIDRISLGLPGFFFGRYDLRVAAADDLRRGRGLKIVELNGVTSEATHIYDPRAGLVDAYRVLFEQWRIAFEIGRRNKVRGHQPASLRALLRLLAVYRDAARAYPD